MKHRFNTESKLFQSIACTVAAVLTWTVVNACGGGSGSPGSRSTAHTLIARLQFGGGRAAIYPSSKSVFAAAMFQAPGTTSLGQSWEANCTYKAVTINGTLIGAHAVYGGSSGFAPFNVPFFQNCGDIGVAGTTPLPSIGSPLSNGQATGGTAVVVDGTLAAVVVTAQVGQVSGQNILSSRVVSCRDTTSTTSVADGASLLPYLRLSDNTVVLGNGQTQLASHCTVPLNAGEDILSMSVVYAKN